MCTRLVAIAYQIAGIFAMADAKQRFKARSLPMDFDCYKSLPEDLKRRNEIESSMKDSVQTVANQFAEVFRGKQR